jgi:predicted oxidoreductase (fatty acid repression mutant protein)
MTYDLDQQIARLIAEHFKSAPAAAYHNYSDRFVVILADGRKKVLDHETVAKIVKAGPQSRSTPPVSAGQPAKLAIASKSKSNGRGKVSLPKSVHRGKVSPPKSKP